jgi:hypothetical protein
MSDLTSLLMYSLNAPTWTARKLDKKATAEVKAANNVKDTTDAGNFNKLILPDCKELQAIQSHIGAVRQAFYLRTAAWGESRGTRVGKAENHLDVMSWFGDEKAKLGPLKVAFGAVYPSKVAGMEYELHGLWNPNDYPPWDVVESKFALRLSVQPLPNVNDVRVLKEIPPHVRQEIEEALKQEFADVQAQSIKNALEPLLDKLTHMAARLKEFKGEKKQRLHDSLTENVVIMADAAKRLNIARDPVVDQIADEAAAIAIGVTKDDLRDSDLLRASKVKQAEALAAKMGALFG